MRPALPNEIGACRKRIKKAPAAGNGELTEDAANGLEDSDVEEQGDDSFIQSDEEELSGTFCFRQSLPLHMQIGDPLPGLILQWFLTETTVRDAGRSRADAHRA